MTARQDEYDFRAFFCTATGFEGPYGWQTRVALHGLPDILPIPTGLGKTEGAILAWAWRRLRIGMDEPTHLVYCLPVRSLVAQTVDRADRWLRALEAARMVPPTQVYELRAGTIDETWERYPDQPWILVGTQDQLLSRALNRGYTMSRFKWPVHFGLLNQDCRWIVDEVQLMGPGLWTTAQLDWMRRKRFSSLKPCRTTWMSATLSQDFLRTTDRINDEIDTVAAFEPRLDGDDSDELRRRRAAKRPVEWCTLEATDPYRHLAAAVAGEHLEGTLTLVVCNTVGAAQELFSALPDEPENILLTSRFRPSDRRVAEQRLAAFERYRKDLVQGHTGHVDRGLICVSTQVIEAGVDISAHRLWSELPPWASVIQRLGRMNRDGRDNDARARFWKPPLDPRPQSRPHVRTGPYLDHDLQQAAMLLEALVESAGESSFTDAMRTVELQHGALVARALATRPEPLPRAVDVHGLFATERDVHGGFTDISAFVRGVDENADLTVFWRTWTGTGPGRGQDLDGPPLDLHNEGCSVPSYRLAETLGRHATSAWIWDDENDCWDSCRASQLRPGMVVMLRETTGGYDTRLGWTGDAGHVLSDVEAAGRGEALRADPQTEIGCWSPIEAHLHDAADVARQLCDALNLREDDPVFKPVRTAIVHAAALHDLGKAHPQWQTSLPGGQEIDGGPWAKCPRVLAVETSSADQRIDEEVLRVRPGALRLSEEQRRDGSIVLRWAVDRPLTRAELDRFNNVAGVGVRRARHVQFRPGFRHEVASALAMWHEYREGLAPYPALAVYLVAAHHGKARTLLRSTSKEGGDVFGVSREPGVLMAMDRVWPLDFSVATDGASGDWQDGAFLLTGYGWTGFVADLLGPWRNAEADRTCAGVVPDGEPRRLGPFVLAWLEALVRAADWRASASPSVSILPGQVKP